MENYRGKRAIALVSGGLDSVVSLAQAHAVMEVRLILFCDYGQRALERERHAVRGIATFYGLPLAEIDLRWLGGISPEGMRRARAEGTSAPTLDTLDAVWIPNRNGVFLNMAAAYAESYGCECVVTGFNREEAEEFPDNGSEYVERVNASLALSTRNGVRAVSFTQDLSKPEILILGSRLGAPLSVIWSCYRAGERMCGRCGSCARLRAALEAVPADERPVLEFEADE